VRPSLAHLLVPSARKNVRFEFLSKSKSKSKVDFKVKTSGQIDFVVKIEISEFLACSNH
jgi:hypothetical protein